MKKYLLILSLTCIFLQQGFSQKFDVGLNMGYGFYQLTDLKKYQTEKRDEYSVINVKSMEQFPGSLNYELFVKYFVNRRNIAGLTGGYYSTAGRNHIKDPTGEYKLDMILNGYKIGMNYQNIVFPHKRLGISLVFEIGTIFNDLSVQEYFNLLNDVRINENQTFKSFAWFLEPKVNAAYLLFQNVYFNIDFSYFRNSHNVLREEGNQGVELENSDGRFGIDWNGFRTSAGFFIKI